MMTEAGHTKPHVVLRRQRLEPFVDLRSGVGLEFGPLDSPVATRSTCDVRYVDVLDTDALREHFRGDPNVELEHIVDVDFPLRYEGGMRTVADAIAPGAPYRWVIASHVIEHVPDLVGWLADVAAVLEDGGQLVLVVPDRRFTFDAIRPPTTVGQLLQAHSLGEAVPSERAVYDHFRSVVYMSAPTLWAGADPVDAPRVYTIEGAASMRDAALRGEYVDSHVWVFSPTELVAQLSDLGELDLFDFSLEGAVPTARDELEFTLVLRRLPRSADADRRTALRQAALEALDADGSIAALGAPVPANGPTPRTMEVSDLEEQLIHGKRAVMRTLRGVRAQIARRQGRLWRAPWNGDDRGG